MAYIIIGLIALSLLGLSFLVQGMAIGRAERARGWASVGGTIADSGIRSNGNGTYTPQVSYTFVIDGQGYADDRLRPGGTPFFYREIKAMAVAARYQPGSAVTVRYDPRRPNRPAIELVPMSLWVLPLRIMAGCAVIVAVSIAVMG